MTRGPRCGCGTLPPGPTTATSLSPASWSLESERTSTPVAGTPGRGTGGPTATPDALNAATYDSSRTCRRYAITSASQSLAFFFRTAGSSVFAAAPFSSSPLAIKAESRTRIARRWARSSTSCCSRAMSLSFVSRRPLYALALATTSMTRAATRINRWGTCGNCLPETHCPISMSPSTVPIMPVHDQNTSSR